MTIQANTGIRIIVMPGARIVNTVVMKLTDESSDAKPSICTPSAQ